MTRQPIIDNAKFYMILLVVLGHLLEEIISNIVGYRVLYLTIYSFHMPAFVMLAGMTANSVYKLSSLANDAKKLLIPLLVFSVLYEGLHYISDGVFSRYIIEGEPYWILWFIIALMLWKIVLPWLLKAPYPLLLSISISLVMGYVTLNGLVGRIFYFLPFFVLGHKMTTQFRSQGYISKLPKTIFALFILVVIVGFWYIYKVRANWLYGSMSYSDFMLSGANGPILRMITYALTTTMAVSVLMLIPQSESKTSKMGRNSLFVYLWHGLFVKVLITSGFILYLSTLSVPITIAICLVIALAMSIILSSDWVAKWTQRLLFSPLQNLFQRSTNSNLQARTTTKS